MLDIYKNIIDKITKREIFVCKIEKVELLQTSKGKNFVVIYYCDYYTGIHVFNTVEWSDSNHVVYHNQVNSLKPIAFNFERITFKLDHPSLYVWDWDDFHNGLCDKSQIGNKDWYWDKSKSSYPTPFTEMSFFTHAGKDILTTGLSTEEEEYILSNMFNEYNDFVRRHVYKLGG